MRMALTGFSRSWGLLAPAAILALGPTQLAAAATCRGVDFSQTLEVEGSPLVLNGLGIRKATFLKISVYVAALYLPRDARSGGQGHASDPQAIITSPGPMELVLHFVRGVGVRDIRNAFEEGFAAQGGGRVPAALASRVALLNSWMRDMRSGEPMAFVRIPGRGVELHIAGRAMGVVPGEDFAQALFAIWLGDHPPNPELKAGLLGGQCE